MTGKKSRIKSCLIIFSVLGFLAMNIWMFWDIMQRENVISRKSNILVMGTNATFKPFEYKESGEIVGFDIDLAKEIANDLGMELKIEDMSFDGLLPALESGQIDMAVAGMSVTEDRAKNALFSDSYYVASQQIIVKNDSLIRNRYALEGKRIGVQLGTTGDQMAQKIKDARVIQFPVAPSVLQELISDRIDAAILDNTPAAQYITNYSSLKILSMPLSRESYAIAIKKTNQELHEKVNKVIASMKEDGRMQKILMRYFGTVEGQI